MGTCFCISQPPPTTERSVAPSFAFSGEGLMAPISIRQSSRAKRLSAESKACPERRSSAGRTIGVEWGPASVFRYFHHKTRGAPCPDSGTWDSTNPNRQVLYQGTTSKPALSEDRASDRSRMGTCFCISRPPPTTERSLPHPSLFSGEGWDRTNLYSAVILSRAPRPSFATAVKQRRERGASAPRIPPTHFLEK